MIATYKLLNSKKYYESYNLENTQNDISTSNLESSIPESDMALDSVQSEQYKVQ